MRSFNTHGWLKLRLGHVTVVDYTRSQERDKLVEYLQNKR